MRVLKKVLSIKLTSLVYAAMLYKSSKIICKEIRRTNISTVLSTALGKTFLLGVLF